MEIIKLKDDHIKLGQALKAARLARVRRKRSTVPGRKSKGKRNGMPAAGEKAL